MTAVRATQAVEATDGPIDTEALIRRDRPLILRGAARDWPLVRAGLKSISSAADYLRSYDGGRPLLRYVGPAGIGGRFFYDPALTGFNFTTEWIPLGRQIDDLLAEADCAAPRALYVGSTDMGRFLPGLHADNHLEADFGASSPTISLWLGNRTVAATHYDSSHNLACCAVGRRRFTLFPPDQIANLYPGPLDPTPGGQVVAMADPAAPDLGRYPRFADALAVAEVADLEPGDILFYPALWWHQVEARDRFNILINYWWNEGPAWQDPPMGALLHTLLALRDRPQPEKQAWRALFDHYIFGEPAAAADHLPSHARGALAPLDDATARRLRALLIDRLTR